MSVALVPIPFVQVIQDGIPVSGAKIFTYASGTTTKLNSYTTAAGDVPNANPVVCDAQGRAVIYLTDGLLYTLVVAPANDTDPPTAPYGTYNGLYGNSVLPLPYADAGGTADVITATYLVNSPTLVDGYALLLDIGTTNATTTPTFAPTLNGVLQTARTIKKSVGNANVALVAGDLQGVVTLIYDLTNLVWIVQDPSGLAGNASQAFAALAVNTAKTTVASATTPDIFAVTTGQLIDYTGTATCTGFVAAPQAGMWRELYCADACLFTAGANLLIEGIPSGTTITLAAGALVQVRAITTTQFKMTYSVSGTFTATGTGFSGSVTTTARFTVNNGAVCLTLSTQPSGTSNTTAFTITGSPACCFPSATRLFPTMEGLDNGGSIYIAGNVLNTGVISLATGHNGAWTASGTKALYSTELTYHI